MRFNDDRKKAVYELQRKLLCLHNAGYPIPAIVPDGIYGEETENAVSVFQGLQGIPQTGRVDERTWKALDEASGGAMDSCRRSDPIYPYEYNKRGGKVSPEDRSDLMYIIQIILRTLESQYKDLVRQPLSGICDETTRRNVSVLQSLWGLQQSGNVDLETWNMMASAYNRYINRE